MGRIALQLGYEGAANLHVFWPGDVAAIERSQALGDREALLSERQDFCQEACRQVSQCFWNDRNRPAGYTPLMIEINPLLGMRMIADGTVVLVSTRLEQTNNIAPVSWHTPLSQNPPLVGIALTPSSKTYHNLSASGEFILSVPDKYLLKEVHWSGTVTGRQVDKFRLLDLSVIGARMTSPLLLSACIGHLECVLDRLIKLGDRVLCVGEVVSAQVETDLFNEGWAPEAHTLRHLGGKRYQIGGEIVEAPDWRPDPFARPTPPLFPAWEAADDREN